MAYQYYQNHGQGWGTSKYQFGPPPAPTFQPQPSWGGYDYFRAHAVSPDQSLYDHAWNRARNYPVSGVGYHEAMHWHNRAYSGVVDLSQMSATELGHAAAYEASRTWQYNSSIYEPIGGDHERQRDALVGLAMAEATRLWTYSGRALDTIGREAACEAAAATANVIFDQQNDEMMAPPLRHRASSSSFHSSSSPYGYGETAYGDGYASPQHRRSSFSSSRPLPIQYSSSSSVGFPAMQNSVPVQAAPYRQPSFSGGFVAPQTLPGGPVSPTYGGASPYASNYGAQTYATQGYPAGSQVYTAYAGQPMTVPAGSTVIISGSSKKRSRRSSHSHRERRHSHSGYKY